MDVSMPELDGFELAEIIHQHPRFQHVPSSLFLPSICPTSIGSKATTVVLWITFRYR